jgi:Phage gp6-like head-tail connector protein
MATIELCTLAQVKLQLGILDNSSDPLLEQLIDGVNAQILMEICRPDLMPNQSYTDWAYGEAKLKLYLAHYPITAIDEITINGEVLPQWDESNPEVQGWWVNVDDPNPENIQFVELVGVADGRMCSYLWSYCCACAPNFPNIKVTYSAGYNSVPLALQQAAIEFVGFKHGLSQIQSVNPAIASRQMGDYSESLGSGRLIMDMLSIGIPQTVQVVIDQYKRIVV